MRRRGRGWWGCLRGLGRRIGRVGGNEVVWVFQGLMMEGDD